MAKHRAPVVRPWAKTVRTIFQAAIAFAAMAPVIYEAATEHDAALATGAAWLGLAIAGGVTRVMNTPQVEAFLQRFLPWLAADEPPQVG